MTVGDRAGGFLGVTHYRGLPKFWACSAVYMHALEGLACARVSLRLAHGPYAGLSAHVAFPPARAAPGLLALAWGHKNHNFSMGPKLRYPVVAIWDIVTTVCVQRADAAGSAEYG